MPKELSHILIAQDVLAELKRSGRKRLAGIFEKNISAFFLGAIIPDAFFYDATPFLGLSKNNVQFARALHLKETAENNARALGFFEAIAVDPRAWPSKVAFAAGIVTHTVSDRIVHRVIDDYTRTLDQQGGLATATHRQFETWIDMVLLQALRLHPRDVQLERLADVPHPKRDILLRFYLSHLIEPQRTPDPGMLRSLKLAYAQQRLCLKLFSVKALYHVVNVSNKLATGRLGTWSSLFYPDSAEADGLPIMHRTDSRTLSDDRFSARSLSLVVRRITTDAISHIGLGVGRLGQG